MNIFCPSRTVLALGRALDWAARGARGPTLLRPWWWARGLTLPDALQWDLTLAWENALPERGVDAQPADQAWCATLVRVEAVPGMPFLNQHTNTMEPREWGKIHVRAVGNAKRYKNRNGK